MGASLVILFIFLLQQDRFTPILIASGVEFIWSSTHLPQMPPASHRRRSCSTTDSETESDGESETLAEDDCCIQKGHDNRGRQAEKPDVSSPSTAPSLLSTSVWLHCGAQGMRIWFPLESPGRHPSDGGGARLPHDSSIPSPGTAATGTTKTTATKVRKSSAGPRRIMLSLRLDELTYPLGA